MITVSESRAVFPTKVGNGRIWITGLVSAISIYVFAAHILLRNMAGDGTSRSAKIFVKGWC